MDDSYSCMGDSDCFLRYMCDHAFTTDRHERFRLTHTTRHSGCENNDINGFRHNYTPKSYAWTDLIFHSDVQASQPKCSVQFLAVIRRRCLVQLVYEVYLGAASHRNATVR